MKKNKSILALILVCVLFFSVASCGKNNTEAITTTTTQQSVTYNETANSDIASSEALPESSVSQSSDATTTTFINIATQTQTNTTIPETTQQPQTAPSQTQSIQATETVIQTQPIATPQTQAPQQIQGETRPQVTLPTETHETANGTYYVYYPENIKKSKTTYPVLAWANGTMCPPDMYAALLIELAKGGYIVIASDETMAADGTAQIAALDFAISLNNDSSSPAYKKINTKQLGVIGHSQGGRSSVNAAVKDSRIKCVVSLAGSNYLEEAEPNSTPTFFIAGGSDMIVSPSQWIQPAYDVAKGPAVYASLNKAIHTTCCTNPEKYSSYILDWCDAWLKNDKSALNTFKFNGTLASDSNWSDFQCKGL